MVASPAARAAPPVTTRRTNVAVAVVPETSRTTTGRAVVANFGGTAFGDADPIGIPTIP